MQDQRHAWALYPSRWLKDRPVGVARLGEKLVLWRDAGGVARAALRACPHRGADLTLGRVVDGELQCPYHGFRYSSSGSCSAMPCEGKDARIPPRLHLGMRDVVEAHGFVWLKEAADAAIPWVPGVRDVDGGAAIREMVWAVPFARVMEGMLDLHHVAFAHHKWMPAVTRLDPYEAKWDDENANVLRTRGTVRKEHKQTGWDMEVNVAFPSMVHIVLGRGSTGVAVCCPIDDQRTWIGISYAFDVPLIGRLLAELALWAELNLIQVDDEKLLASSSDPSAEVPHQLVRADKGASLWHARRRRSLPVLHEEQLQEQESSAPPALPPPAA